MRPNLIAVTLVLAVFVGCSFYNIQHDPKLALRIAKEFCDRAFVRQEFHTSFEFLNPARASDFTEESLREMTQNMHPAGEYPTSVNAVGYEIVPGKSLINVYVNGICGDKTVYYLIVVYGDQSGYVVSEMYRRDTEFSKTGLYKELGR